MECRGRRFTLLELLVYTPALEYRYVFIPSTFPWQRMYGHKCLRMCTVHTQYILYMHCTCIVHARAFLLIYCTYIVHTRAFLFIYCTYIVHTWAFLFIYCTYIVHTQARAFLFIHCTYIVHRLSDCVSDCFKECSFHRWTPWQRLGVWHGSLTCSRKLCVQDAIPSKCQRRALIR